MTEDEIRKQIIENLDDNVFVEAGAGAGKTSLIVSRIINQLKHGFEPKEIVVITFTNAAAEELRSRIIREVRAACKADRLTEAERECLTNALQKLDLMNISTIHSFCLKLLKERIFDARLPMDATLLEENEAQKQHAVFFTEWASALDAAAWNELKQCRWARRTVFERIEKFFMAICELPDDTVIQYNSSAKDCNQEMKQLMEDFAQVFIASSVHTPEGSVGKIEDISDDNLGAGGSKVKKAMLEQGELNFALYKALTDKDKLPRFWKKVKKNEPAEDICKAWWEKTGLPVGKQLNKEREDYEYGILLKYAVKARDAYRAWRPICNVTNDDLLQKTQQLVCENKEARDYFADRIRCLYVDEFQDTDHIQEEFIWSLAATKEDLTKLRDGALFLVGDPKQSIYRFRGAEPEVYFDAKAKMKQISNAKVYCLDYNFRSNEKIVKWVNDSFQSRQITSREPYHPMIAKKTFPEQWDKKTLAGVYYYQNPEGKSTNHDEDAKALSVLIRQLVTEPYQIVDYKNGKSYERPISYSDILILCYKKGQMDRYFKEMTTNGIPVQINGSLSLKEHQALGNYVRIYDYLTHPYDLAKKIGALEALEKSGLKNGETMLKELLKEAGQMSVYGVAEYLLHRIDVLLPWEKEISKSELLSAQTKLQQMFESVLSEEQVSGGALSEAFWNYCDKALERELSLEEAGNSVRFMNLHKAKGLEGNIVIIAKRDEDFNFGITPFRKGIDYYPAFKQGNNIKWSSYQDNPTLFKEAQTQDMEEKTRLQYVAATRAKQALIVMDAMSDTCMFTGYPLKGEPEVESVEAIIQEKEEDGKEEITAASYTYENRTAEEQKAGYRSLSPSGLEQGSAVRQKAWLSLAEEEKEQYRPKLRPLGNILGNVMHRSLELLIERWRVSFEKKPEDLQKIIDGSVRQAILENDKDIDQAQKAAYRGFVIKVLGCFAKWAYEEAVFINAKAVYTEMTFSYYKEQMKVEEEVCPVWMNGTADLIIENMDGSFLILDYKSDYAPYLDEDEFKESLLQKYTNQLLEYRYAVSRLYQVEEEDIHLAIISFAGDEEVILRYTEIDA